MAVSVPFVWHIYGILTKSGQPFSQVARIKAVDFYQNNEYFLGETGVNPDGGFTITYTPSQFRTVDPARSAPDVIIRVIDYNEQVIWESNLLVSIISEFTFNIDLDNMSQPETWELYGIIKKSDQSPVSSGRVAVIDLYEENEYSLGDCQIQPNGTYHFTYDESQFQHDEIVRSAPDLMTRVYDDQNNIVGMGSVPYPPSNHQVFNMTLAQTGAVHNISGVLLNTAGSPIAGYTVTVKSIMLVGGKFIQQELGKAISGPKGTYTIFYYPAIIPNLPDPSKANVIVEVSQKVNSETVVVATSEVINGPLEKITKDLTVEVVSNADLSILTDVVSSLEENGFTEEILRAISADETKIQYAAAVTGLPEAEIEKVAFSMNLVENLREKLESVPNVPNLVDYKIVYALVKTGNVKRYQDLYTIDSDRLHTVLVSAITQSIIAPETQDNLENIVREWETIQQKVLDLYQDKTNAGRIFKKAALPTGNDSVQSKVLQSYAENAHNLEKFWETLDEAITEPAEKVYIDKLKFFFDIQKFADEFGPLSSAMMDHADAAGFDTLENFVQLEEDNWKEYVIDRIDSFEYLDEKVEWPESVPGETDDEKRNNYALILFRRIATLFPMARFRFKLFSADSADIWAGWNEIKEFLTAKDSFDFVEQIKPEDLEYRPDVNIETLYEKLSMVQRLYRLTPGFSAIDELIKNDFKSAMSIAHVNTDDFIKEHSDKVGGIDDAQALHAAAVHTASQALFLMGTFNQQSDLPKASLPAITEKIIEPEPLKSTDPVMKMMAASPAPAAVMQATTVEVRDAKAGSAEPAKRVIPDIATLFGRQNQCRCQECQSIFSPSAYMVDLIEFLNDSVRGALFSRRPDLSETDLSCRNTNGPVAYIDLVNEILEDAVCTREFYITADQTFLDYLNETISNPNQERSKIPFAVISVFSNRGFPIDSKYYVQPLADTDNSEEDVETTTWYMVGDTWRYLVERSEGTWIFRIKPYPQTGKDAQLRRAKPEHTHRGAYEVLKHSPYPVLLPLSLAFEEINAFLKLKNSRRHKLYHALIPENRLFDLDNAKMQAFFEMTDRQLELVLGQNVEPYELWNLKEAMPVYDEENDVWVSVGWVDYLSNAQEVMDRTGFTFDQLLDIMSTYIIYYNHSSMYLNDANDDTIERGELSEIIIENASESAFLDIACFHRLCNHLGLDVFTVDRLLAMGTMQANVGKPLRIDINEPILQYVSLYLRVAEDFSVSPLQAALWLSGWLDNFNLGRGPVSQLEQLFINTIESPHRNEVWKSLVNDAADRGIYDFEITGEMYGGDIGTLLKGLKVNYDDLSLIAYYELRSTDYSPPYGDPDARRILQDEPLKVGTVATMLRVADFSKALGLKIREYYTLCRIITNKTSIKLFTEEYLYECRAILKKIKKFGISLDTLQYLLHGTGEEDIAWLADDNDELKLIYTIHSEITKIAAGFSGKPAQLQNVIEETVANQLASFCKIPIDSARIFLEDLLYYSSAETTKSLLQRWVDICTGGWNVTFYTDYNCSRGSEIPNTYTSVPAINIVAKSNVNQETLPTAARSARWSAYLVVTETAMYDVSKNCWYFEESGSAGTVTITITDPETGNPITSQKLQKGAAYPITVKWSAPATDFETKHITISCLIKKIDALDSIPMLLGTENTIRGIAADVNRFANSAYLLRSFNIKEDELSFIATRRGSFPNLDFNTIGTVNTSFIGLFSIIDTYILNSELPFKKKNVTLFDLWRRAYTWSPETTGIQKYISMTIDWQYADITAIMNLFSFDYLDCRTIQLWRELHRTCGLLKDLGISALLGENLLLLNGNYSGDNTLQQGENLISALKSQYSNSQWVEAAEPIMDKLRARQRDALCAYLLSERYVGPVTTASYSTAILSSLLDHALGKSNDSLVNRLHSFQNLVGIAQSDNLTEELWNLLDGRTGFVNRAGIYAKYLIDINMEPCIKTTRIVQANSSIQMLIQRATLGFEAGIELNDKIRHQWMWMKNYRLWEANRKIFLYPENWLEPELRDDKTPLFKELESGLLQKDLNRNAIEEVFKEYATGLSEVANLEVIGAFSEEYQSEKVLHVVGRTFHFPHAFYYRRNHDSNGGLGYWSPWEKIDLDITADVVIPVPFRNKIYLFWPIIEVKEKPIENEETTADNKEKPRFKDSFKYFELKLAWSEYFDGKWSAKRISQNTFLHVMSNIDDDSLKTTDIFHFRAEVKSESVEIEVYAYNKIIEYITIKTKVVKYKKRGLFKRRKRKYIEEIETILTNENEAISKVAAFSFGADNNAKLISVDDERNLLGSQMIPSGTEMRHNRAEESTANQEKSDFGALEYPQKNPLLKRTPEYFTCFPTNLSFFENVPKPFFLQLQGKILFFKPVPPPEQNANTSRKLDYESTTFHQIANFYHPLADDVVKRVNFSSIDDLLNRSTQAYARDQYPLGYAGAGDELARHLGNLAFQYQYMPDYPIIGDYPTPVHDFSLSSAFGVYNWELFFHLPLYIATRLSKDNKFEDAMRWFHFIFNPAGDLTTWEKTQRWVEELPDGARFWNFLPFFANKGVQDTIYKSIEKSQIPDQDTMLGSLIESWKNDPFKPHLIARVRVAAYQKAVVMKYLDNLISWGDNLFRLDNMESINEATQLYTYASQVLGEKPVLLPQLHEMPGLTYRQMKAEGLDQFSNTVIQLENYIPPAPPLKVRFWRAKQAPSRYYYYHYNYNYNYNSSVEAIPHRSMQLLRMAPALHYFCIPRNDRLTSYWSTVEDRLFKIRNSLNIDGIKREIPLFAPPIDPGMLARAAAMGISIGALLKDIQSSPTVYRYATVYQKAVELCNELKSYGSELLSAIEKNDAEKLTFLRNTHEIDILNLVKDIKKSAVDEAQKNLEATTKSKETAQERFKHYNELQDKIKEENEQLEHMKAAHVLNILGQSIMLGAPALVPIPDVEGGCIIGPFGGATINAKFGGGEKLSTALNLLGNALTASAGICDRKAGILGVQASYKRRSEDWTLQKMLAEKEIAQIDKQILATEIRLKMAEYELRNQEKQIEQALTVKEVMESKFSNEDLYRWMSDELTRSYNLLYDITYSAAKKAEKAYQFELGSRSSFIIPEIWDSSKKGMLAGQRLMVQLRQMDLSFIENNRREMEITKAISLKMVQPDKLLELRETGICQIELPELIYDIDFPGQYFRRIKSVRITIPCITGPYTNVNARLKLTGSKIRTSTELSNGEYGKTGDDNRFLNNPIPPMTIATSNAQMDSGMFEFTFRDERYLPFEGAGAESTWELQLPGEFRQFDYRTISDVILHISYTAREASSAAFIDAVKTYLGEYIESLKEIPNLISLKQSFPAQYDSIISGNEASISLDERFLPSLIVDYIRRNSPDLTMRNVAVYLAVKDSTALGDIALTIKLTEDDIQTSDGSPYLSNTLYKLEFGNLDACDGFPLGDWVFSGFPAGLKEKIEDMYLYFDYPSVAPDTKVETSVNVEQLA